MTGIELDLSCLNLTKEKKKINLWMNKAEQKKDQTLKPHGKDTLLKICTIGHRWLFGSNQYDGRIYVQEKRAKSCIENELRKIEIEVIWNGYIGSKTTMNNMKKKITSTIDGLCRW